MALSDSAIETKTSNIEGNVTKTSMEILSELFSSFDAEPPIIVKKEKKNEKKHKKLKKKHKRKEKKSKHGKKRKRSHSEDSTNQPDTIDLAQLMIKKEKEMVTEVNIKIEKLEKKQKKEGSSLDKLPAKQSSKSQELIKLLRDESIPDGDLRLSDQSEEGILEYTKSKRRKNEKKFVDTWDKYDSELRKRNSDYYHPQESIKYRKTSSQHESSFDYDHKKYRDRNQSKYENSGDRDRKIDKKKLLEIARRNAIQMIKTGDIGGVSKYKDKKVLAAIKSGGKTIGELTDFCKTLSNKEELEAYPNITDNGHNSSESENEKGFHHPFQIKEKSTSITLNIKDSISLPVKTTQERSSELRIQFPVSSGQQHRKTENDWIPVSHPRKNSKSTSTKSTSKSHMEETIQVAPEQNVFPEQIQKESVDIGSIVSQRLSAMRKLQENPMDVQALSQMFKSNKEMQYWAESKQQPGQFTGSTGVQILSQAQLSAGYQAWAKKDQLQSAAPLAGGMGMHLLQKMGWKPGEGLGKEKTGSLEPLLLEVKLDKKGLVATEEQKQKKHILAPKTVKMATQQMQGKHPVSLLGEYASKKKIGAPEYVLCFECGPDHKKNFLFKVILNGVEYKPNCASGNKKEAKSAAATVCLKEIGLLPIIP